MSGTPAGGALEEARLEEGRQAAGVGLMMRVGAQMYGPERYQWLEIGGGLATYAGPGAWANQAMGLGLDGPVSDEELDRLVEFYESRGVEPRIELAAPADPSVMQGLERRRFLLREIENVLIRRVSRDDDFEGLRAPLPEGLALERVDLADERAVDDWTEVATSGFRPAGEPLSGFWLESGRIMARCPGVAAWVVRDEDGRTVAGGSMEVADSGAAALFGVTVVPEHRRLGIQTRLIAERLLHARDRGASQVAIHSSPHVATGRNSGRLGFRLSYCKAILVRPGEGLSASV